MKKPWGRITAVTSQDQYDGLLGFLSMRINIDGVQEEALDNNRIKFIFYTRELEKLKALDLGTDIKVEVIEYDPSIETEWKKYFKPQRVGRNIVIRPSWERYDTKPSDVVITIDPGAAFGTGLHGTTKGVIMCLEEVVPSVKDINVVSLLDAGTGSGILAITAYKLGIKDIKAIDNDIEAVNTAEKNFELNSIPAGTIRTEQEELSKEKGTYNIVLANILAETLIKESLHVSQLLKPKGHLILSGILTKEEKEILGTYNKIEGLKFIKTIYVDEWATLILELE